MNNTNDILNWTLVYGESNVSTPSCGGSFVDLVSDLDQDVAISKQGLVAKKDVIEVPKDVGVVEVDYHETCSVASAHVPVQSVPIQHVSESKSADTKVTPKVMSTQADSTADFLSGTSQSLNETSQSSNEINLPLPILIEINQNPHSRVSHIQSTPSTLPTQAPLPQGIPSQIQSAPAESSNGRGTCSSHGQGIISQEEATEERQSQGVTIQSLSSILRIPPFSIDHISTQIDNFSFRMENISTRIDSLGWAFISGFASQIEAIPGRVDEVAFQVDSLYSGVSRVISSQVEAFVGAVEAVTETHYD